MRYLGPDRYIFLYFKKSIIKKVLIYVVMTFIFISACNLAYSFQVLLAWDPNDESNIAGYKTHYGTSSRNYAYSVHVGLNESVTISGLQLGSTYYFAVTAYDSDGNESNYSTEISYQMPKHKSMPWIQLLLLEN